MVRRWLMVVVLACSAVFAGGSTPASALYGGTTLIYDDGMDSCQTYTTSSMDNLYALSPYWVYGFYLGGESTGCRPPSAAALAHDSGVSSSTNLRLAPLYTGLQNPCSLFANRISMNNATAEGQGQHDATLAKNIMVGLGFPAGSIAYYDMEGIDEATTSACITAMTYFVKGWDEGMHGYGFLAGYYGSECGSFINSMAISIPPDDVWFRTLDGNPDVTKTAGCLTHWSTNDRRIKQYVGQHTEPWGGTTFTIDNDCVDAVVDGQGLGAYGC